MNRVKLIKHIQKGTRLLVDDVRITTNKGELTGKGRVHCKGGSFRFMVTLDPGQVVPEMPPGIYGLNDFWPLSATIEDHLPFKAAMGPLPNRTFQAQTIQLRFGCDHLDLEATGTDRLTSREIGRLINRLEDLEEETIEPTPDSQPVACDCHFEGLLNGFQLIDCDVDEVHLLEDKFLLRMIKPRRKVLSGSLGDSFEYLLWEKKEGLEFHLQSKAGYQTLGEAEDLKHLNAFLNAIGFVFGRHPWHFLLEYRRDGKLILDRVRPDTVPANTRFTAFTDRQFYSARVQKHEWSTRKPIALAYAYFLPHSVKSREMSNFLFHFREAAKGKVHVRISATVLCPILENLVRSLSSEFKLRGARDENFEKVRNQALAALKAAQSACPDEELKPIFERFLGRSEKMEEWDTSEYFRALVAHSGLAWEPRWEQIFTLWKKHRNLVLHRGKSNHDDDYRDDLIVSSRIAGAINVLVLKRFGFSGQVRWSAYNDDYGNI